MIKLSQVSKKYHTTELETTALDGVDFGLTSGEFVAIASYVAPLLFAVGAVTGWFMSRQRQRQHDLHGRVMRHARRVRHHHTSHAEG